MKLRVNKIIIWPLSLLLFIGFTFLGNIDTLCIGENGHMEFETECNPCCDATSEICTIDTNEDFNGEHDDCGNCSDLILDGPLLTKLVRKINSIDLDKLPNTSTSEIVIVVNTDNKILPINISLLTFSKYPQSASIAYSSVLC